MDGTGVTVEALASATNALGETKLLTSATSLPHRSTAPGCCIQWVPMWCSVVARWWRSADLMKRSSTTTMKPTYVGG